MKVTLTQFAPCCKKLSSRHATSQMALIRGISKSTTPPVALKQSGQTSKNLLKVWPKTPQQSGCLSLGLKRESKKNSQSWSCWRISWIMDLDIFGPWLLKIPYISLHYTQFCKCHSRTAKHILSKVLCKFSLVFKAFEIKIPWQQRTWRKCVWATYFLSKTTLGC